MRDSPSDHSDTEETSTSDKDHSSPSDSGPSTLDQYYSRLAQVNGVVTPSKRLFNEEPLQPSGMQSNTSSASGFPCPICRAKYSQRENIKAHFVACVERNGNPRGRRWNDGPQVGLRPQSERSRVSKARLDAVNGVVIASKLAPGALPTVHASRATSGLTLNLQCPLCGGLFGRKDHVKSHFPTCVETNGNPGGLRWDDGL